MLFRNGYCDFLMVRLWQWKVEIRRRKKILMGRWCRRSLVKGGYTIGCWLLAKKGAKYQQWVNVAKQTHTEWDEVRQSLIFIFCYFFYESARKIVIWISKEEDNFLHSLVIFNWLEDILIDKTFLWLSYTKEWGKWLLEAISLLSNGV